MARTERKKNDENNDIFSNFDEGFEEMRARMDMMMKQMLTGQSGFAKEPIMYGVSMRVGPDGQPHIQEFGNVNRPVPAQEKRAPSREPLTDVIEENDSVRVIIELPGVQKDDVNVSAADVWLDVSVDTENRKFSKRIELPCAVRSEGAISSYKNGVLEIRLDREPPKRRKKRTIVP